jgi:hypothetical protein
MLEPIVGFTVQKTLATRSSSLMMIQAFARTRYDGTLFTVDTGQAIAFIIKAFQLLPPKT